MADPGTWAVIISAVAGIGSMVYGMATSPGAPELAPPPPPPNYTTYDDDGNVMTRQEAVYNKPGDPMSGIKEWRTYSGNIEPPKPTEVPDPGAAPDRNNYFTEPPAWQTDDSGNGTGPVFNEQRYNAALQAWQTQKSAFDQYQKEMAEYQPKYDEWKKNKEDRAAEKAKLAELRTQMLDNLNKTPDDRVAAYDTYAKAFADSMHADVDPRFQKLERSNDEQANATGMFGSRAYVDTKSELATDKLATDTDIANQATMAKEALADNDRKYWAAMLDQIDNGARSDKLVQAQVSKNASDIVNQNYAGTLGYYSAKSANRLAEWEAKQAKSASYVSAGSNLAGGLLYLYGGKTGGGAATGGGAVTGGVSAKPTGGGVQRYGQNFRLLG